MFYFSLYSAARDMRWAGLIARMGEMKSARKIWVGKLERRDHLGDRSVDGRIILRLIPRRLDARV
jgi:hypothetical protein